MGPRERGGAGGGRILRCRHHQSGRAAAAGKPDATGATLDETLALARTLSRLPVPVTVDIEGGFARHPDGVAEVVARLSSLGIAGVNIEDGRPDGSLTPLGHQVAVIRAVKAAAPEVFLNARTDTFWVTGDAPSSLSETSRRAGAYADAGADGVFVPGVAADEDILGLAAGRGPGRAPRRPRRPPKAGGTGDAPEARPPVRSCAPAGSARLMT